MGTPTADEFELQVAQLLEKARKQTASPKPSDSTDAAAAAHIDDEFTQRLQQVRQQTKQGAGQEDAEAKVGDQPWTDPVGDGEHVVRQGECMSSIAKGTGHYWETLWNDPANRALRDERKDPNVLFPGDRVHIAVIRPRSESGQTEMRHRFVRLGEPTMLRIRVLLGDKPRRCEPYELKIGDHVQRGKTDGNGNLQCPIPARAMRGELKVGREPSVLQRTLLLGEVDPIDSVSGVQARLNNLDFQCGSVSGEMDSPTREAIRKFQRSCGVTPTGDADADTRKRLQAKYGA